MPGSEFFAALESSTVGTVIAGSELLFPSLETLHVLAIVLVVGTIMIVDLRLLNLTSKERPVSVLMKEVLPWTWGAFGIAALSGGLLFTSAAVKYSQNPPFQFKMGLLLLAGVNMAVFHLSAYRRVSAWDTGPGIPLAARLAAGLSLCMWVAIVALGRWIGFTT